MHIECSLYSIKKKKEKRKKKKKKTSRIKGKNSQNIDKRGFLLLCDPSSSYLNQEVVSLKGQVLPLHCLSNETKPFCGSIKDLELGFDLV